MPFYIKCASTRHKAKGQCCNKTLKPTRLHPGPAAAELYNLPQNFSPCRVCAAVMNGGRGISILFPLVAAKSAHSATSLVAKGSRKKVIGRLKSLLGRKGWELRRASALLLLQCM